MSTNSLILKNQKITNRTSVQTKTLNIHPLSETTIPPRSPSVGTYNLESNPIQSYKEEMVASFFTAMLGHVIEMKDICDEPKEEDFVHESDPLVIAKDFKDLVDNDLIQQEVVSVDGSLVSLSNKSKKIGPKRNSVAAKRSSHTQGSVQSPNGTGKKRKQHRSNSSTLSKISESETAVKNLSDFYQETLIESWRVKDSKEYVTITFKNGNIYKGPLRNHLFHGEGSFYWNDGTIYFGHFDNGEITGFGKMIYNDMSIYHGNFFNGKPHGIGAFYMAYTRTLYNGNWVHGKKEGKGWLYYSENNWYDGEWHDDYKEGFGIRLYGNGTKYSGMWKNGNRHGDGGCSFTNGDFYKGEWHNGEFNGYGEYTWRAFFNKSLTFPVENIYQGQWKNGSRDGFGHMYFGLEHGARVVGFWTMNFKHGMGIVINSNGEITERNPLFYNDKPTHLSRNEKNVCSVAMTQKNFARKQKSICSMNILPQSSQGWLLRTPAKEASSTTLCSILPGNVNNSAMEIVLSTVADNTRPSLFTKKKEQSPSEQMSNVQKIERLQDFPEERLLCNPLILHTRAAPETLNLSFYIKKYIVEAQEQMRIFSMSCTYDLLDVTDSRYEETEDNVFWKETADEETNNLRNVIWHNTKILKTIYGMYAKITCHPDAPNRSYTLIRLYLWQLYRDLEIYKHGISLYDTDQILLENPNHCLETDHHPFERIYYWQFLWSLIGVAWKIHIDPKNKVEPNKLQSIYVIFEDFLKSTVYPKAGHHLGPCLFEFKNLLPIEDVIALYEEVGPLLTARDFLNKCCCKKRTEPRCHLQNFGDNSVIQPLYGINTIAVGRNFHYLIDKKDEILTKTEPEVYPLEIDKFFKTLQVFRHIGPQRVLNCLTLACPIIKKSGVIVNMEVKLTFLEFYETLIFCAYKSVLLANLKERCKNVACDESRRSEKSEKRKKSRKDTRRRKK